jgi:hypothetical protein
MDLSGLGIDVKLKERKKERKKEIFCYTFEPCIKICKLFLNLG